MTIDRNLLCGVRALQAGFIEAAQFAEICTVWSTRPTVSLLDLLLERGWIDQGGKAHLEALIDRSQQQRDISITVDLPRQPANAAAAPVLAKHDPDATMELADNHVNDATANLPQIRDSSGTVDLVDKPERAVSGPNTASDKQRQTPPITPPSDGKCQANSATGSTVSGARYTQGSLHATGGMGRVWRARDTWLDRDVALKDLRPEVAANETVRARFLREARITGQLEHPGIVPVYELSRRPESHEPFYTMRFVKGRTLTNAAEAFHGRRLQGQTDMLDFASLLSAFVTVCNTVAYAHAQGVIHRDLKGNNVLLGDFGEVIVLDWGLAKRLDQKDISDQAGLSDLPLPAAIDQTMQGEVMGTPAFMAPEQAHGRIDHIDRRTDIYGLGAVLFEILTGEPPFVGLDTMEVLGQVLTTPPMAPHFHWREVPPALEAACLKALAKKPADRYQSAAELGQEVKSWQEVQRRQAEDALRRQTEVLQSILNSMSEAVLVADRQGQVLHINPGAERLLGARPSDTTLAQIRDRYQMFQSDKVTPFLTADLPLERAIRGQVVDDVELFIAGPVGPGGFWVSANARPLLDEKGALRGGVLVIRDVSERKRVAEELHHSRERFELAVAGSQDGLWDWDLQTNVVYFSPRWKSIIGYYDNEIAHHIGEWDKRLHPDERDTVIAANLAHINGRTPFYEYEYRLRHKDGSYRWILARGVALRDANGKAYRMAGSHVDVTERKEAEEALRQVQEGYQAVMAALPLGIVVLNSDGSLRDCNAAAQRLLGLSQQRNRPLALPNVCRADGSPFPPEEEPLRKVLRTGQASAGVIMRVRRDDGERWLSVAVQPFARSQSNAPAGAVAVFEDVTGCRAESSSGSKS